jgi:RimJ/RimL family protein N-acetyltransferase
MHLTPIVLEDSFVKIMPMVSSHINQLFHAGNNPAIWEWTTSPYCMTLQNSAAWVNTCLANQTLGTQYPFVIFDKKKNQIVGSTSYLNIQLAHKAIEIGFTFLSTSAQRTHVNRRCKYLLLTHAFETLGMNRVALQTHELNNKSRQAILGIGATFEGVQRDCRIQHDGTIRSSAFFSIIKPEWPNVKTNLKNTIELNKEKYCVYS